MEINSVEDEAHSSTNCNIKDNQQTKIRKRLQWYIYYIIKYFEEHMSLYLRLSENEVVKNKSNSKLALGASTISNLIPGYGKQIGTAIKEGELFCYNQKDKRKSRALSELITHFRDNKSETKANLIHTGVNIFSCFEEQFSQFTCKGGNARAMQKLAEEAVRRIFNYTINSKDEKNFDMTFFGKGIINGESKRYLKKRGRSVYIKDTLYKTFDVYDKVGIYFENANNEFIFKSKPNNVKHLFYRKLLPWEKCEDFIDWKNDTISSNLNYNGVLTIENQLFIDLETYYLSQSSEGEAKLEREYYHKENLEVQESFHNETIEYLSLLLEHFYTEVKEQIFKINENIEANHCILDKGNKLPQNDENENEEIKTSLAEIKYHIDENNQYKIVLQEQNKLIEKDLEDIKKGQATFKNKILFVNINEVKKIAPPQKEIDKAVKKVCEATQSGAKEVEKVAQKVVQETDKSVKSINRRLRRKLKF